ncbi:MAG: GNAT family N-acetyltransferase [Candidatus Krumholzibacteriota bacterium]|nr:GNAT family N-acetyltransferase [Candidatus Krumholzibacteriota bacterium]
MVKIEIEERVEEGEIYKLLDKIKFRNFFNTPIWIDILESSFSEFSARWITARIGKTLLGFMPVIFIKRNIFYFIRSLPFGTYGTPVAEDGDISKSLVEQFLKLSTSFRCLNATAVIFDPDWDEWLSSAGLYEVAECRIADLKGGFEDYRMVKLSSSKRKACNGCQRAGVVVRPLKTKGEVLNFYDIYTDMAARWGGVHPFPLSLFMELFVKGGSNVLILGAFLDNRLLGGHVDFYYGDIAQAWQAGVSEEAKSYGVSPYLVLRAIEEAYRRKMKFFNMGSSGGDEGLIYFKESLGGREFNYPVVKSGKRWWEWIRNL